MTGKQLLTDKLTTPKLPRVFLPREKLLKNFNRHTEKQMVFVSAPPGYGKTVSTRLWLSSSDREIIWIGLDGYDNIPSVFYKLFCTGMLSVQPENREMINILRSPSFVSSPIEHTIRLLSEFAPSNRQYALVLDDMHLVTNKEILKSGLLVRKRLPLSFVTLILTRNEVAEEYANTLGEGRYAVITSDDLAFSADEIQKFFYVYGRSITMEEAAEVRSITGGWAMGVNALIMSGQIEPGQNGVRILGNYLKEQIWDKWDKDLQEFMLKTAAVDEMSVTLCNQITGRNDGYEVFEELCGTNSFVSRLSEDTYVYHHLFLDFLRNQSEEQGIDTKHVYKEAAKYYIDRNEYFIARRYAVKSEDLDVITQAIYHLFQYGNASVDEFVNFSKLYADEIPPESLCNRAPFLYTVLMWENYLLGNAAKMEYYMDKTYQFLPVIAANFPQILESVVMQFSLDHRISLARLIERFTAMPPFTYVHENQQGATLTHEMPFLHRSNRDYYELSDDALRKKLDDAFGQLLRDNREIIMSTLESGLLLEKNRLEEALAAALRAKNLITENTSAELRFCAFVHLTAVCYAMKTSLYGEVIAEAESFIEKKGIYYLRPNFMAFKIKVLLLNGDRIAAMEWFDNYFVTGGEPLDLYKIYQYFTTAEAHIVLGQTEQAMRYIVKLKQLGTDFRRPLDTAEACVLQAILEWASGRKKESQLTLEIVLEDMQPYGFIRVIAIHGAAILPVLKRIDAKIKKEEYQGPLQSYYVHKVALAAYEQSKRFKGIAVHIRTKPVRLSKQQKLILSLLASGYKYTEIMEATGLTIHTVKSHVSAAYKKLDTHNSMDATVKARELGLIE